MTESIIPEERSAAVALTSEERARYSRHLIMPEVTMAGQRRLKAARVLCIGAGGLGSPAALYLAAAGVGTLGLVDADRVELSNLQRQLLHGTSDVGRSKLESARDRLHETNPNVQVQLHEVRFTSENAMEIVADYDVVVDGSDNFPTRYSQAMSAFSRASQTSTARSSALTDKRPSSPRTSGAPVIAVFSPNHRRRERFQIAPRPACSACFPGSSGPCKRSRPSS